MVNHAVGTDVLLDANPSKAAYGFMQTGFVCTAHLQALPAA